MPDQPHYQVIVVEDDDATRRLIERQLQKAGYPVASYGDGRSALQPISEMGTGLVIADWDMPVMTGLELCRSVRELEEMQALGNIYLVLVSSYTRKDDIIEGLAAGANDYLTKPYHLGELLARLRAGERILRLQEELIRRTLEIQKANAQMALLANRLELLANTDALTRLANRRSLFRRLEEVWHKTRADHQPLACVMLDVDRFKAVNDTFGHAAGDVVLHSVGDAIRRSVRRPDLCGRFGGEEFLVLCPFTELDAAVALAEQIREAVASQTAMYQAVQIPVTVSCGVAQVDETVECPDDLVRAADAMLYLAKTNGRNQTWVQRADGLGYAVTPNVAAAPAAPPAGQSPGCIRSNPRDLPVESGHANSHN